MYGGQWVPEHGSFSLSGAVPVAEFDVAVVILIYTFRVIDIFLQLI